MLASRGPLSASEIGDQFPVSPPAISQHLKALRAANLVRVEKRAQQRLYHLNPEVIRELECWARQLAELWSERFDLLERVLKSEKKLFQNERTAGMNNQSQKELTITRSFDAPRDLVFKAWTDPKLMAQWFAPDMFTIPVCELDAQPGGAIYLIMRGSDGVEFPMTGVFHEVVAPERIVFTSGAVMDESSVPQLETLTTVTLSEENGKTNMILHEKVVRASPMAAGALSGMEEGWKQSLEKLAEVLVKA